MASPVASGLGTGRSSGRDLLELDPRAPDAPTDAEAGVLLVAHHREQIPYLYTAMGLLSTLLVVGILFFAPQADLRTPSLLAVIAASAGAALGILFLFRPPPVETVYPTTFLLAVLHVAVALHFLRVFGDPSHAAYLALLSLVVAYFLTSRLWYLLFNGVVLGGWLVLAAFDGGGPLWAQMTVLVAIGILFGVAAHHQRVISLAEALLGRARQETQRQLLEETVQALERSEARFQLLSDVASEGVCLHREGRITEVNRAFRRLFGCSEQEAVGATLDEFLATREEPSVRIQWSSIAPPGQEILSVRVPGVGRRVLKTVERRLHEGPNALRVSRFQDVSAEAHAHEELQDLVDRLREAERISEVGHWVRDLENGAAVWSEGTHRILGTEPHSVRPGVDALFERVHPEDRERVARTLDEAKKVGDAFELAFRIVRPDGSERHLRAHGEVAHGADGKHKVIRGVLHDITVSRGAEEKFRTLLESAPDAMIIADDRGHLVLVNSQAERLFGYGRDELIGQPVEMLVPDDKRAEHTGKRLGYMQNPTLRGMGTGSDLSARRKDGSLVPVEISLAPMHTPDGMLVIAAVRDITERRKAAEADRLAYERLLKIRQLKEIDRLKTSLLNTASHELNTPLTPLKLQIYMMREGQLGPTTSRQDRALGILDRNLDRLSRLIQDVLDVARLQSGRLRLERTWEDVTQLLGEGIEAFAEQAKAHQVELRLVAHRPHRARVDPDRVTQVLYNLLSNSLKVTQAGDRIDVSVGENENVLRIEIHDTGAGLSDKQIARLFQPFTQVHDQLPSAPSGTGLGLYISKGIVEQHGGRIWVESDGPGKGCRFIFTLPTAAHDPPAAPADEDEPMQVEPEAGVE